jgi:MoxR-like ATPase
MRSSMTDRFTDVAAVHKGLADVDYLADDGLASIVYLADRLEKPVLVEGPAGTGKTQLAKSVAEMIGARLIRLQCYEGLDESKALYEWNYKKQLLRIQSERDETNWDDIQDDIFSNEFLLERSRSRPRHCSSKSSPTTRCRFPSSARSSRPRFLWSS